LKELLTEYGEIFTMNSDDSGRTDRVYQHIDTGEAQPKRQLPRRLPITKQADVREMLEDI
jgi:hypothetical protein